MRVVPVAHTAFTPEDAETAGWSPNPEHLRGSPVGHADTLSEFAGRNCYQAWERKNPATATNKGYLSNILDQGHFSVLEHASITFYVDGVSRALLTELERHRFLSFSVISQRYVNMAEAEVVIPPVLKKNPGEAAVLMGPAIKAAFDAYSDIADTLEGRGVPRKQAREAARSVLPNATEVKMVVTGNVRAWRDVISRRYHEAADAEIREFATEVLKHLRVYAPNSVQDIPEEPYK